MWERPLDRKAQTEAPGGQNAAMSAKKAHVVAVCSRKGGVGKTTTAVHFSVAAASRHGLRVLLVDLDPQSHVRASLASRLGSPSSGSLSGVLLAKKGDMCSASQPSDIEGLDLVLADDGLESAQLMLSTRIGREFVVKSSLAEAERRYDLVVLDCPPNVDTLTLNALVAARWVLTPTDLSVLAMDGVAGITEALETIRDRLQLPLEMAGILVTRVDRRCPAINREMMGMMRERFGERLLDELVPHSTAVSRACLEGKPVYEVDAANPASKAYLNASAALLTRLNAR